jgi:hypothetical protein
MAPWLSPQKNTAVFHGGNGVVDGIYVMGFNVSTSMGSSGDYPEDCNNY